MTLPIEAERLCALWGFSPTEELAPGHCSRIFADSSRVLKVPFRGEEQISGWKMAVKLSGNFGPTVEQFDPATGSLLMERIDPGTSLADAGLSDRECFDIVRNAIEGCRSLNRADELLPLSSYFEAASAELEDLIATSPAEVALHGDLHHYNILRGSTGWKVIDPKGLRGDPSFEAIAFLRNPIDRLGTGAELVAQTERRLRWFEESLSLDADRIIRWALLDLNDEPGENLTPWGVLRQVLAAIAGRS